MQGLARPDRPLFQDHGADAVTVTVLIRLSAADARRLAARTLVFAGVAICVLFILALVSADPAVAHLFDCLHWTVAYVAAAVVAWLGVAEASGVDRAARRWFAIGLTFTPAGDLLDLHLGAGRENPGKLSAAA